jgi:hypothetical protein
VAEPAAANPNAAFARTLYGDLPVAEWPIDDGSPGDGYMEPWTAFIRARHHLADGDEDLAIREWSQVANPIFGWESRHVLQAWRFLRDHGLVPDASIAGEVLGVVAEVPIDAGHDVLAAYRDGSVRYLNHAGGATVVEVPAPPPVAEAAEAWLAVAQAVADGIGPWDGDALPPLAAGDLRFTMLTRGGHRFGQGPAAALSADPGGGGLLAAATALLQAVVGLGR